MRRHAVDLVALAALLAALPGLWLAPAMFFASWLTAWWFCLLTTLGLLANGWIHALTGGRWGQALHLVARPVARGLPWLCLLFLPMAAGLPRVFPWAGGADWTRQLDLPAFQLAWFSPAFFWTRMALYALLWCALARPAVFAGRGRVAAATFAWVVSGTLATTDLVVSLLPGWYSTAHGLVNLAGGALGGAALATLVLARRVPHAFPTPPPRPARTRAVPLWRDLGNLLLMWTMLWAYVAFVEFLIQWAENLPREVQWIVPRVTGGWAGVGLVLALLQFGACFVALLFRANKDDPRRLAALAAALLGGQLLNCAWLVLPSVDASSALGWWLVPALALAMGLPVASRAWRAIPLGTVLPEPPSEAAPHDRAEEPVHA